MPIEQATTPSLAALKAYALGLEERRKGRELESVAFFNRAIELDPEFAAAYTTLSTVYGSLGEWRRSEEYARLAYDRQKRVSERERLLHHVPVPRPRHRQSGRGADHAGAVEALVPARLSSGQRAGRDPQPASAGSPTA